MMAGFLFREEINGWDSWGRVFQKKECFRPLIEALFLSKGLPAAEMENCPPGTHAVFRVGNYIVKIYAPLEAGAVETDSLREVWGLKTAYSRGVCVPKLIADGCLEDRYRFHYLITEFLEWPSFAEVCETMPPDRKIIFGRQIRDLTDRMNLPVYPDWPLEAEWTFSEQGRWREFPESFLRERREYLSEYRPDCPVFLHNDLNPDNILVGKTGNPVALDFGDSTLGDAVMEEAIVTAELFRFDPWFLQGYYGEEKQSEIARICREGLLLHPYGGNVLADRLGDVFQITTVAAFQKCIETLLQGKK